MPLTYLFNPENDLALAADVDRYTAPAPIRRLRADLALLPMWIASPGSRIIAPADGAEFLDFCKSVIDGLDGIGIYDGEPSQAMPWGWSRSVRNELLRAGVECKADDAMLSQLRRLSSRQTTVDVLQQLDAKGVDIPAMPKVCHSLAEAAAAVEEFDAAVLKMPWSSSGRAGNGICQHDLVGVSNVRLAGSVSNGRGDVIRFLHGVFLTFCRKSGLFFHSDAICTARIYKGLENAAQI